MFDSLLERILVLSSLSHEATKMLSGLRQINGMLANDPVPFVFRHAFTLLPLDSAVNTWTNHRLLPNPADKSVRSTVPPIASCDAPKKAPVTIPSSPPVWTNVLPLTAMV